MRNCTAHSLFVVACCITTVTACFDPKRNNNLECSPEGNCPDNLVCDTDNICRALVVSCTPDGNECDEPPSLCMLPGTCNAEGRCEFPNKVCESDGSCTRSVCNPASGQCESTEVGEGESCGDTECEAFGPCDFGSTCAEAGTQTRSCTDYVCTENRCEAIARDESADCSRSTEGQECGERTCGSQFGPCDFGPNVCSESGVQTRVCQELRCADSECTSVDVEDSQPCTRSTDGNFCQQINCPAGPGPGFKNICCLDGMCNDNLCDVCPGDEV